MYTIKKNGALWQVITVSGKRVQITRTSRKACAEWIKDNTPANEGGTA